MRASPHGLCRVDFIVVLESVSGLVLRVLRRAGSGSDISVLRALRVLRPLRAVTYIKQVSHVFHSYRV